MSSVLRVTRLSSKRKSNHSNGPARKTFVLSDDVSEQIPPIVPASIPLIISETDTEHAVTDIEPAATDQPANDQPGKDQPENVQSATEPPANDKPANDPPANDQPATAESKIWLYVRDFQNKEELDEYLKEENCWSKVKTRVPLNRGFKTQ